MKFGVLDSCLNTIDQILELSITLKNIIINLRELKWRVCSSICIQIFQKQFPVHNRWFVLTCCEHRVIQILLLAFLTFTVRLLDCCSLLLIPYRMCHRYSFNHKTSRNIGNKACYYHQNRAKYWPKSNETLRISKWPRRQQEVDNSCWSCNWWHWLHLLGGSALDNVLIVGTIFWIAGLPGTGRRTDI